MACEQVLFRAAALEVVEGLQFDRGYLSPYFVTDNTTTESVLEEAYILITDGKLNMLKGLEDVELEQLGRAKRIVVGKEATTLIGGAGARARGDIDARIKTIRREIER